jgi:hypothetical protein
MSNLFSSVAQQLDQTQLPEDLHAAGAELAALIEAEAIVYVRTDRRNPTLAITKQALKLAFPDHHMRRVNRPLEGKTQTRLFGNGDPRLGEVDLVLTP